MEESSNLFPLRTLSFSQLPLDVLLNVFSYLPLRSVLQLEHLSPTLHDAVSSFLSIQKSLNVSHTSIYLDAFFQCHPTVVTTLSNHQFDSLIQRCPRLTELAFLPMSNLPKSWIINMPESTATHCLSVDGVVSSLTAHQRVSNLHLCTSAHLMEALCKGLPHVVVDTLHLSEVGSLSLVPFSRIRRLHLRNVFLTNGIPSLPLVEEMTLVNVLLEFPSDYVHPTFPHLCRLSISTQKEKSMADATSLYNLIVALAGAPCLTRLALTLRQFAVLRELAGLDQLRGLCELVIRSSGPYSAAFQQYNYALAVAEICAKSASTLEHIDLPSSVLVKQFFRLFPSNDVHLPRLKKLDSNGIADTKLFLAPGNLVEAQYYRSFLDKTPAMKSLSLHTYSGSLRILPLPLGLTDVTLPWDNRLDLVRQRDDIVAALMSMLNLQSLAIAGVEEADALVTESALLSRSKRPPVFELAMPHLEAFKISNVCLQRVGLAGCSSLRRFTLHCCPSLQSLSLPTASVERVFIYEHYVPLATSYLDRFVREFVRQSERASTCHLHLQLHSIVKESESGRTDDMATEGGDVLVGHVLGALGDEPPDYLILKKQSCCVLEHNSGELMFACTEFHPHPYCASRSFDGIEAENRHRDLALEGISRWVDCISRLKTTAGLDSRGLSRPTTVRLPDKSRHVVSYCSEWYECLTDIPWLFPLSDSVPLSQPSCHNSAAPFQIRMLNVPRLHVPAAQYAHSLPNLASELRPSNPLLVISVMEFVHNIHTLFYYA